MQKKNKFSLGILYLAEKYAYFFYINDTGSSSGVDATTVAEGNVWVMANEDYRDHHHYYYSADPHGQCRMIHTVQ